MKIPVLLATTAGTLIAFAEARNPDCGDFSSTVLVYKRSLDRGMTWSPLAELVQPGPGQPGAPQGLCGHPAVVGNAAPVQLGPGSPPQQHPGRILVPHMRNNYQAWLVHSDDDGVSWSPPRHLPDVVNGSSGGPDCTRASTSFWIIPRVFLISQPGTIPPALHGVLCFVAMLIGCGLVLAIRWHDPPTSSGNRNMSFFGLNLTKTSSLLAWAEALGWSGPLTDPYVEWARYMVGPWQFVGLGPPGSVQMARASPFPGRVVVPGYKGFDIILDPISRVSQPSATPHAPRAILYLVAMQMEC